MSFASISQELPTDQKETLVSLQWQSGLVLDYVYRTTVELNLFEIISNAGPGAELSAAEIAAQLPTKNEEAPEILDMMLHLLASHSIVKSTVVYDEKNNGAKLEGGRPFEKAHEGMNLFQYLGKNEGLNMAFNDIMNSTATNIMRDVLQSYKGFENLSELVNVGGGVGVTLNMIISKYSWIRGVNFDLPHVIKNAPNWPGVKHVEGDMFKSIPKGEAILIKRVLHGFTDEECIKVLKNCLEALPESGKVIIIDMVLPESSENDLSSRIALTSNMIMYTMSPGEDKGPRKSGMILLKVLVLQLQNWHVVLMSFVFLNFTSSSNQFLNMHADQE